MRRLTLIVGLLLAQSLAAQTFDGLTEAVARGDFGAINSVIVSRQGETLYEAYFRGASAGQLHQVNSVTKSVGSALIGIAHRQGSIRPDQSLAEFFGDLYPMTTGAFQDKAAITVEQLLQQRHGIAWDESSTDYRDPANPVARMVSADDWYRFVLTQPTDAAPGAKFTYCSGASTLMSRLIRAATGTGVEEFAWQELFQPLGFESVHWEGFTEQGMGAGLTDWPNPDHDPPLGFSLWMTARDMVRFGELYLNGGVFAGQRILDADWVRASWTPYSHPGNSDFFTLPGSGHGYQWWIYRLTDDRGRDWQLYFASGWGSQVIFVLPELQLVVVTTANNYDHPGPDVDVLLRNYVVSGLNPVLDQRFSGSWYDPATDGQGFSMEVLDDRNAVVAYWYTYTATGEQRWFVLQGEVVDGVGEVDIYSTSGGVFLQPDPVSLEPWGTGRFAPSDCDHIDFSFQSPVESLSGSIPLTRLTGSCFTPPTAD